MEGFSWWLGQYPKGCETREGDWSPPICFWVFAPAHMIHAMGSLPDWVKKKKNCPAFYNNPSGFAPPPLSKSSLLHYLDKERGVVCHKNLIRWAVSCCWFFIPFVPQQHILSVNPVDHKGNKGNHCCVRALSERKQIRLIGDQQRVGGSNETLLPTARPSLG